MPSLIKAKRKDSAFSKINQEINLNSVLTISKIKSKISQLFYQPYFKLSIFLLFIIIIAGCVTPRPIGGGLFVTMKADPQTVFSSGIVRLNVDLDNQNPRSIRDIDALIFDPGIM